MTSGHIRRVLRNLRRYPKVAKLRLPERVECNVCGWKGREFLSSAWHRNTICPRCKSDVRHRLMISAFSTLEGCSFESLVQGKRVLHFAPELDIELTMASLASKLITADYFRPGSNWKLDISDMARVDDGDFDLVIACDVLEHVPNDIGAMHEMFRVLSAGGCAVLTVPQKDHAWETYEDPQITTPQGRERAFGQKDHLRIYGDDFSGKLTAVGFHVVAVSARDFDGSLVQRHVLLPPELSPAPLATNYRKVFFAFKDAPAMAGKARSTILPNTLKLNRSEAGKREPGGRSKADTHPDRRAA